MAVGARTAARKPLYEDPAYVLLKNRLAANLRRVRGDLSQEEAAHRAGLATRLLQRMEHAETNVTLLTLARLCAGLQVDVAVLFAPAATGGRRQVRRKRSRSSAGRER